MSENTDTIDEMCREMEALEAQNSRLKIELDRLKNEAKIFEGALWVDKTGLTGALASIVAEVKARHWILEGRGPYTYDDERYQREAGIAFDSIEEIATKTLNRSGLMVMAADLAVTALRKD